MNEQFQQYLMGILEKTGEFLSTEVPEVANQILMYYLAISSLCVVTGVTLALLGFKLMSVFNSKGGFGKDEAIPSFIGLILCFTCSLFFIFCNIEDVLKIWLAPKLYLLEYASSLVK